jgi:hypothetical protein
MRPHFQNHISVKICKNFNFKYLHRGIVKETKLSDNSASFRPFLGKSYQNVAADLSGRLLFYSAPFELCGRTFGQLATLGQSVENKLPTAPHISSPTASQFIGNSSLCWGGGGGGTVSRPSSVANSW